MAETDPIDRDTALFGLTAIGVDLYGDGPDPEPDSILDPVWRTLTNDDHRWLRERLDDEGGAFDRMVADYESRTIGDQDGSE
jgi:hypothetical protein